MNILIIEDDEIWQQQVYLMLTELPEIKVEFAKTLEESRTKLASFHPDLVIADIRLSDGLTFDLFENPSRNYPIIFMTSYASHQLLNQALTLSNTTFIVKPFHTLTLIAIIRSLIKINIPPTISENHIKVLGKFKQTVLVPFDSVLYVEANGNYMKIHTQEKVYSYKSSLKELVEMLDNRFLKIHKSFIINTIFVKRMDLSAGIVIVQGKSLPIGRVFRKATISQLTKMLG